MNIIKSFLHLFTGNIEQKTVLTRSQVETGTVFRYLDYTPLQDCLFIAGDYAGLHRSRFVDVCVDVNDSLIDRDWPMRGHWYDPVMDRKVEVIE